MKYKVLISQTVQTNATIEIEANSPEEAENLAWENLRAGDYDDDFVEQEAGLNYDCEQSVERVEEATDQTK